MIYFDLFKTYFDVVHSQNGFFFMKSNYNNYLIFLQLVQLTRKSPEKIYRN